MYARECAGGDHISSPLKTLSRSAVLCNMHTAVPMAGADGAGGTDNINKKSPVRQHRGKDIHHRGAYHETAFIIANMPLGVNDL